jgi:hypothetical protein
MQVVAVVELKLAELLEQVAMAAVAMALTLI